MKKKEFINQLKSKNEVETKKTLTDFEDKLWSLKADLKAGKVKNVAEIRMLKRNIARLKTLFESK